MTEIIYLNCDALPCEVMFGFARRNSGKKSQTIFYFPSCSSAWSGSRCIVFRVVLDCAAPLTRGGNFSSFKLVIVFCVNNGTCSSEMKTYFSVSWFYLNGISSSADDGAERESGRVNKNEPKHQFHPAKWLEIECRSLKVRAQLLGWALIMMMMTTTTTSMSLYCAFS